MTFSIGDLKFIDSFQFMASSLEKLVENLYDPSEDKFQNFKFMKQNYPEHMELLCQKGYYPYEWVNGVDKLDHKRLTTKKLLLLISQTRNYIRRRITNTPRMYISN